jgi:tRNA threonylcarbamoyladenosine biosynthesis protein TsaE
MSNVVAADTALTYHLETIHSVAASLLNSMADFSVCVFQGEMGSGKTTLIKAIGHQLGVEETMASPTFSIINEYQTSKGNTIYHFDFYRLKKESEAYDMGVHEYFDSGNLCLVEWPNKIPSLLPTHYFEVHLTSIDAVTRALRYGRH